MFTLYADWRATDPLDIDAEMESMLAANREYQAYLERERPRFPASAFEYASAAWRNNFNDHRAPHDALVATFRYVDRSLPPDGDNRLCDLELVLLGAYHDGHLQLTYRGVHSFKLGYQEASAGPILIYRDEVRLSERGQVLHEIEFLGAENWLVECNDIEWSWVPFARSPANDD